MRCIGSVVALLLAASAFAGEPFRIAANPDPLRAGSLPIDVTPAAPVAAGEWRFEVAFSYANLWQGTWETAAVHAELGRLRQPVGSDELREIERRYPDRELYRVDLEGWRTDLVVQHGLAHGLVLTAQLPYLDLGRPHWDGIAEWWHRNLSLPNADRGLFPRGDALLYAHARGGSLELRDGLRRSGIGDLTLSLAAPLGSLAGATHRIVVSVDAPTGGAGTLLGSGGWDVGARWFAAWRWRSRSVLIGGGDSFLDRSGSLLGVERADTWHTLLSLEQSLGRRWSAGGSFTYESSPLANFTNTALGEPGVFLRLGITRTLAGGGWIALDTGQDWFDSGVAPDYAFRLSLGFGPRPR